MRVDKMESSMRFKSKPWVFQGATYYIVIRFLWVGAKFGTKSQERITVYTPSLSGFFSVKILRIFIFSDFFNFYAKLEFVGVDNNYIRQ
jgi:hypothetical protein